MSMTTEETLCTCRRWEAGEWCNLPEWQPSNLFERIFGDSIASVEVVNAKRAAMWRRAKRCWDSHDERPTVLPPIYPIMLGRGWRSSDKAEPPPNDNQPTARRFTFDAPAAWAAIAAGAILLLGWKVSLAIALIIGGGLVITREKTNG